MDESLGKFKISLGNMLLAITCITVGLGFTRLYPANPLGLIGPEIRNLPANGILNFAIVTAAGGAIGAIVSRFRRGISIGAIVGAVIAVLWTILRFFHLGMAANSV
jgi:hypothetical protein